MPFARFPCTSCEIQMSGKADESGPGGMDSLADVIDAIDESIEGEDEFAVGDIMDAFGTRAFGGLLVLPALVALSPVGAIPGVPTTLGLLILTVSAQHTVGLDSPWVPSVLRERSVSTEKWDEAKEKIDPWVKRIDRVLRPRLTWLTKGAADRALAAAASISALVMILLEIVPFAVMIPGAAILLLGLAIVTRDGLAALVGLGTTAIAAWIASTSVL